MHILEAIGGYEVTVKRNDELTIEEVGAYDKLILSPGPGLPKEAGLMPEIVREYFDKMPILGVCLGHQAIVEHFYGKLYNLPKVYHGVAGVMKRVGDCPLFQDIPDEFEVGRYHSWVADKGDFPEQLVVTSQDPEDEIMSFHHHSLPVYGVQFHPESILTPLGRVFLSNFLQLEA